MTVILRKLALTALLWTVLATPALAEWVEAKSENFIFRGDTTEEIATDIVNDFEEFRAIIFTLMKIPPSPEVIPVKIYGVRTLDDVKDITGQKYLNGAYRPTREGPVTLLNLRDIRKKESRSRQTAYHEYSHHLIANYTDNHYPSWYNEGFAEYLSTFKVDKNGRVEIGLPNERRGNRLKTSRWFDMDKILSTRRYPKVREDKIKFYAQSWLAVHFILSHPDYSKKFMAYLKLMNSGTDSLPAFEKAFKISPDDFEKILQGYYRKNKYRTVSITLENSAIATPVQLKKLSQGESYFWKGEAIRTFRPNPEGRAKANHLFGQAEKNNGPLEQIAASRALLALSNKENVQALSEITKALDLAPNNSRILQIAGHLALRDFRNKETPSSPMQIKQARNYLKQAMRADPQNLQAHYRYVSTFAAANDTPNKQALYSAQQCAAYYKHRNFMSGNLQLAEVLARGGKSSSARKLYEKVALWARNPKSRTIAQEKLKTLN